MKFHPFYWKKKNPNPYCLCCELWRLWVKAESELSCSVSAGSSGRISVDVSAAELFWSVSSVLGVFCCGQSSRVVFEYSPLVRKVHPFMPEPSGPRYSRCEGVRAQQGCRAVGGPWLAGRGAGARWRSTPTATGPRARGITVRLLENMTDEENVYAVESVGARVEGCVPPGEAVSL